jgi:hypothetical protein
VPCVFEDEPVQSVGVQPYTFIVFVIGHVRGKTEGVPLV